MSQLCTINKCSRQFRGLCDCCQQNLCLQHLSEHNTSLLTQLNPLTDEINALGDRLSILNIDQIIGQSRQKLEQWRDDCHKQIDALYKKKCQELHQSVSEKIEQQRNKVDKIRAEISELINAQEATRKSIDSLKSNIHQVQQNMNSIEKSCITIDARPLIIDERIIIIQKPTDHELDILTLSPAYRTIQRQEASFLSMASNDRYLLLHRHPNLCLLDHEMNIMKEVRWSYNIVTDMCWSLELNQFILLEGKNIFLVDENTMAIEKIQGIGNHDWFSCTSSDTVLYASTNQSGSSIMEFSLVPRIKMIKEWKTPLTCTETQIISGIVYSCGKLVMTLMDKLNKSAHVELKSVINLDCIWSLQLNFRWTNDKPIRCCILPGNEWLAMEHNTKHLIQITKDGKMKKTIEYPSSPYRATLLNQNTLAIGTHDGVNLHRIQQD